MAGSTIINLLDFFLADYLGVFPFLVRNSTMVNILIFHLVIYWGPIH